MLNVKIDSDFRAGAARRWRGLAPAAANARAKLFKFAGTAVVGWGAVVALGAALLAGTAHHRAPAAPGPEVAAVAAPSPPAAAAPAKEALAPAPPAAPAKVTSRVDTTPTGSIAETPKPKHKPQKKKKKDLDSDH